jgi:dienelactone hydrolase
MANCTMRGVAPCRHTSSEAKQLLSRNQSPQSMFLEMALRHKSQYSFNGTSREDFALWKKSALPPVIAALGDWPKRVPLNPELIAEWEEDGLIKQRWLIDVGEYISASLIVAMPVGLKSDETRPAILCWHGHGRFGKDSVMGNKSSADRRAEIERYNYSYGHQMAKSGFITYAIDWMGVGERNDNEKPHYLSHNSGRDWCNLYYLHATMFGMTSLSINLSHGMAATDFVCTLPHVDSDKLGVMGLSGGGTMTLWTALTDKRMKAAEIICYSDLWPYFGMRDLNYCGMQITPGLFKLVDLPDLQGLLAPMPLLIDIGAYDTCFLLDTAMACFKKLEPIYSAAGARDKLELDFFPGEHSWAGNKSKAFFDTYLSSTENS